MQAKIDESNHEISTLLNEKVALTRQFEELKSSSNQSADIKVCNDENFTLLILLIKGLKVEISKRTRNEKCTNWSIKSERIWQSELAFIKYFIEILRRCTVQIRFSRKQSNQLARASR